MAVTVLRTVPVRENYQTQESQLYARVDFNSAGVSSGGFVVGKIPAYSLVKKVIVAVESTFNAATTNVFTVGTSTSANEWVDSTMVDEATALSVVESDIGYGLTTSDLTVRAKYTQTGTAASAGRAHVWVEYNQAK